MSSNRDPGFPSTDWELVSDAATEEQLGERLSLSELLTRYLPAMRAYLFRGTRIPESQIDDLLQSFVTDKMIGANLLAQADRTRGRFRNLLVRALENYLVDHHRHATSSVRAPDGGRKLVSLSEVSDDGIAARASLDPARAFDRTWAESVIAEALRRAEARCVETNRRAMWEIFVSRTLETDDAGKPLRYSDLVARLGLSSPTDAQNALVTAKRIFLRSLRATLRESAGGGPDVNVVDELADLQKILGESGAGY